MSKILIVDIETTGFSPTKSKIVEIGIVSLDLSNGEIDNVFSEFINEGITREELIDSWIFKNSNIKVDDILNAKSLHRYFVEIHEILLKYPGITAYNNKFDLSFLQERGFVWHKTLPCPMELATDICQIPGKHGLKWPKVEEAYHHFFPESNYVEKHRGADDAKHEAEIVYELYKLGFFKV